MQCTNFTRCFSVDLCAALGFSTWNSFRCGFTAQTIKDTIDLMVSTGLAAAGYEYVNLGKSDRDALFIECGLANQEASLAS